MTDTQVQQARSAIEAAMPRLTHMPEPDQKPEGLTITYLWTPNGHEVAEYYTHPDGSFAGGIIGMPGASEQLPFFDLIAFASVLVLIGDHG